MTAAIRWFRDVFRDAVWESEDLNADEKAVLETYARHAKDEHGDKSAAADRAWATYPRLQLKAGVRKRATIAAVLEGLEAKGWLKALVRQSRRPTLYQLLIPHGGSSAAPGPLGSSDVGTTDLGTTTPTEGTTAGAVVPTSELPQGEPSHDRGSDVGATVVPDPGARSSHGGTTVVPKTEIGSSDVGTGPLEDPPSSRSPSTRTAAHTHVAAVTGGTDDEIEWILRTIKDRHAVRNIAAYVRGMTDADLIALHAEARTALEDLRAAAADRARHEHLMADLAAQAAKAVTVDDKLRSRTQQLIAEGIAAARAERRYPNQQPAPEPPSEATA